jgi:hypothetical protein
MWMKMDLSHWRNLNQEISFRNTKKQYYNRFLWRAEFHIKKVGCVTDSYIMDMITYIEGAKTLAKVALENKAALEKSKNINLWFPEIDQRRHIDRIEWLESDASLLDHVRNVVRASTDNIKFRVEKNVLQIYTETEDDLKQICNSINYSIGLKNITGPKAGTEQDLRDGCMIMGSKTKYKFKILLSDGTYDFTTKKNILNQLKNHKNIKVPESTRRSLSTKYPALWGAYIYTNDDSIATILSLVAPGIVGKIHPIIHLNK